MKFKKQIVLFMKAIYTDIVKCEVTVMTDNTYMWLKNILDNEYRFVKNIKRTSDTIINVLENKHNNNRVLVKYLTGTADVYIQLLNIVHPNIPIVYEVMVDNDNCIIVEEYIDGITVGEVLETGLYSPDGVTKIIGEICEALYVLHNRGIVHRDIKPENIIVDKDGCVKLIDFNISRINIEKQDRDTVVLGTTGFAPPEQYGISDTDARSDIYSIGILINVMLTGEHPSKKMCSGKWQRIVNKCTQINPDERFQNVGELMRKMK